MDQEELVDELIALVFHTEPRDPNAFTNERMVRAEVWDLIDRYDSTKVLEKGVEYV